jgi:hypothetical protein
MAEILGKPTDKIGAFVTTETTVAQGIRDMAVAIV